MSYNDEFETYLDILSMTNYVFKFIDEMKSAENFYQNTLFKLFDYFASFRRINTINLKQPLHFIEDIDFYQTNV
jgi:hypothetical protein